jgi:hypothetical protein
MAKPAKLPIGKEVIERTREFLRSQGLLNTPEEETRKLEKVMVILGKARNTQSSFYDWEPSHGGGITRKIKNKLQMKLKNIILNTLEKYVMRQQKYNEVVFQGVTELYKQNLELKEQLKSNES